jgi:hypothetical protein
MPEAFYHEQAVVVDGETITLAIDFRAIDATESLFGGRGYDDLLEDIQQPKVPVNVQAKVLWGLLREHHSDLSMDQILTLVIGERGVIVGLGMSELYKRAFPTAEKAKGENPPKPRGASKIS